MLAREELASATADRPSGVSPIGGPAYEASVLAGLRVLVVVPTYNEERNIENVLMSLLAQASSFASMTIAVVDGASNDCTPLIVQRVAKFHACVRLLANPARIQSAAVNRAALVFGDQADVLIRCDAHAAYPATFCARTVSTMVRVDADAVVVPMDSAGHGSVQRAVAWISNSRIGTGGSAHRGPGARSGFVDHGHHAAIRIETFRKAGGYDETFTHNEDAEFDCRQRALGARVYLDSEIRIEYHPRSTLLDLWLQYFRYGAGRSRTIRKHPTSVRIRQLAVVANALACLLALLATPWTPLLLAWPALYLGILFITSIRMSVLHRSLSGLLTGVAAGIMHLAWACGFVSALFGRRERVWTKDSAVPLWRSTSQ